MLEVEVSSPYPVNVAVRMRVSQPVGLMKKPSRLTVISIRRTCSGTPSMTFGIVSVDASMPVSEGRSLTWLITTTCPRSIGPTFAGTTSASVAASLGSSGVER